MEKTRKCPYCGEEIMADARKCRHCGEWLNDEAEPKQEPVQETATKEVENQPRNETLAATAAVNEPLADSVSNKPNESLLKSCFWEQITKHYCDFKGNADRKTFWICYLYWMLIMWVIGGISIWLPLVGTVLMWIVSLGLTLPFLGLSVRRLHDIGKKGAWILIALVPLVGPIWYLVLMAQKGESQNPNKWNVKDTVITIAMLVVSIGLYVLGLSGITSNLTEGISRKDNWIEIGTDNEENEIKTELEYQVLEAYNNGTISDLVTPGFKAAQDAADVPGYLPCLEWDYFYDIDYCFGCDPGDDIDPVEEQYNHTYVSGVRAEIIGENKAHVYVTIEHDGESEPTTLTLVMTRNGGLEKWFVDDVRTTAKYANSIKEQLIDCANNNLDEVSEGEDGNNYEEVVKDEPTLDIGSASYGENRFVVIDGSELRLRLGPSTSSETLKWGDGSNRHPNVGDKFRYLGESGDFYKIAFDGKELWVSKQYTHIEPGGQVVANERLEIESEQEDEYEVEEEEQDQEIFQIVEEMPSYPGGEGKLMEYVAKNIKYPQIARETGIQGRVFVGFVVEPDGSLSNVKVLRGIGGGCDEEAMRVVENMPKWKPGKQRGKAVRVSYMLPINFKIQ